MSEDVNLFCTFEAAGRLFGIPLSDIKEVSAEVSCTHIPHAPGGVKGYVNIRGQITLGLDLIPLLKLESNSNVEPKRLVIFKPSIGPTFGLLVDEIGEIETVSDHDFDSQELIKHELAPDSPTGLIDRVCRLPKRLLIVINPRKFLPLIENQLSSERL